MKIEDPRSVQSSPVRPSTPATAGPARTETQRPQDNSAVGQPAARVDLSSRSREMHSALQAAYAAPDVRQDKVNDAKQRIAAGTYTVDAGVVARGILDTKA